METPLYQKSAPVPRHFLMGNEAVALGARHAGAARGTGYPGTPSSEILDEFNRLGGPAEWAPNEKVAAEVALGVAFAGAGAFVTMKHVGLNVASDVLFTAAYSGVDGALVFVVADDPGMASSQNEQDSRRYAVAAGVPLLEPSDSQDAYDFTRLAFELSRRWHIPVLLKLTTRVCHSGSVVVPRAPTEAPAPEELKPPADISRHVMVPGHARPAHQRLRAKLAEIAAWNEAEGPNLRLGGDGDNGAGKAAPLGIVTAGSSFQYAREAAPEAAFFKIGMVYPPPMNAVLAFVRSAARAFVIEENDPVLADAIRAAGGKIEGAPELFRFGELNVARVRRLLAGDATPEPPPPRAVPPQLCAGCPHSRTFASLKKLGCFVAGDIGCYTLAATPPLSALHTQICMGAGIGVGLGLRHTLPREEARRVVSVIGDSTFFHSGLTGLAEMAYNTPPTGHVLVILDNATTAMTGQQHHPGTGRHLDGSPAGKIDYEKIARAMNIPRVETFDPLRDEEAFEAAVRDALEKEQLAVFVSRRPCVLAAVAAAKAAGGEKK
ncbi:thiamine pyrophosphate-dependent enzyme [Termitidicoccus mucosus]|uniref:Indolepyruvate oxidoreductase subunit IorA n=1 Tax=Termitidicoccus mucosus TaxID=1184151 RepID=A0A178IG60_9BACT|nr:thiamine pyrophosphate-binding protein [Opitutaceae bacterium TSB47]